MSKKPIYSIPLVPMPYIDNDFSKLLSFVVVKSYVL